ncbi:MAG: amidohydrolase [Dehalococcoidia bacterium]
MIGTFKFFAVAAFASGLLAGSASDTVEPDAIYHGGKIVTVNEAFEVAEAIAIRDGRIVAVGTDREIRALAGAGTHEVNLRGRTIVPGFYDNHVHLGDERPQLWRGGLISRVPDWIRGADTLEELSRRLEQRARETPEGEWLVGGLTREEWPNQRLPTRWQLDEIVPDHPVALSRGPHTVVINSLAFDIVGITRDTPDPPGGWIIRDEESGEPSGRILEAAKRLVNPHLPESDDDRGPAIEQYHRGLSQLLELGITSLNVAGVRPEALHDLQDLYERHGSELPRMTVQLRVSPGYDTYDDPVLGARETLAELEGIGFRTGFGNERLKIGAVKMSIDGGLSAPVMWTRDAYHGRPDFFGVQRIPDETFYEVGKFAHDRGWQLGIHTIGDGAVVMVVDQLARILRESPRENHRHYLHHVNVKPPEETLRTMGELEIMVATHPSWTTNLGAYTAEAVGPGPKLETQNPSRSLLDHGIRISYGSDGLPLGPLVAVSNAVTRLGWDNRVYGPEEAVSVEDAIRFHTMGTAYMTFDEHIKGSLEVGKVADFVILAEDILTIDPELIGQVRIDATIVGGKEVFVAN